MPVCCGSLVLNAIVPMTPSTDENPVYTIFADCSKCGCRFRLDGCRIKSEINKETTEVEMESK